MEKTYDVIIVGCGAAGLFCALHLPKEMKILCITKDETDKSDSFLAQGGICVLHDENDYDSFMEDTLKAGHYENRRSSVDKMIRSSRSVIEELIGFGVDFARKGGELNYTREGGHSKSRILFHADVTGKEITSTLLAHVEMCPNVTLLEYTSMVDLLTEENRCRGIILRDANGALHTVEADYTVLACGGVGGLYEHSTNFRHMTGDALAIGLKHGLKMEHLDYVQIHPTTLYSKKPGRRFLISESVRGEGALLYGADGQRFTNELLPRDILTGEIRKQMAKDGTKHVWLDMRPLGEDTICNHFPNIREKCMEEGYDVLNECIPVVPAQHYFMGGIWVDTEHSQTSMDGLYAVGETSCNGVHGKNRLASNSLLESLVFSRSAAEHISERAKKSVSPMSDESCNGGRRGIDLKAYEDKEALQLTYKTMVLEEMERVRNGHV